MQVIAAVIKGAEDFSMPDSAMAAILHEGSEGCEAQEESVRAHCGST